MDMEEIKCEVEVKVEPEVDLNCSPSDKLFKSERETKFSCVHCGKTMSRKQSLQNHMRIHTGEKPYICHACGKGFSDPSGLASHKKVHDINRKKYTCDQCGREFTRNSFLKRHLRLHEVHGSQIDTNVTLAPWEKLEKKRYSHQEKMDAVQQALAHGAAETSIQLNIPRGTLDAWIKLCTSPVSCDECGAMFGNNSALEQHKMRVHSRELNSDSESSQPIRIHEESFKSEVVAFALANSMEEAHKKYNNISEKAIRRWVRIQQCPVPCNVCGKKFAYEKELKRHEITHLASKEDKQNIRKDIENEMKAQIPFSEHFMAIEDKSNFVVERHIQSVTTKNAPLTSSTEKVIEEFQMWEANEQQINPVFTNADEAQCEGSSEEDFETDYMDFENDNMDDSDYKEASKPEQIVDGLNSEMKQNLVGEDEKKIKESGSVKKEEVKEEINEFEDISGILKSEIKGEEIELNQLGSQGHKNELVLKGKKRGSQSKRQQKATPESDLGLNTNRHMCSTCGQRFKSPSDLDAHQVTHTGVKQYLCELCPRKFAFKNCVGRHMRTVHSEKKAHICPECGKGFSQKHHVDRHIRVVHTGSEGDPKYSCDDCGNGFIFKSKFLTHRKQCPFKKALEGAEDDSDKLERALRFLKECHVCGKKLTKGGNLKRHIQAHFKIKEFTCNICNDKYADNRNLKNHLQRAHPQEAERLEIAERLHCEICGSHFQQKRDLELHKVNDHNEKYFFVCACGEGFLKTNFQKVMARHRPLCSKKDSLLICQICEQLFTRKQDLYKHLKKHTTESLFICDECGEEFTDTVDLQKHMKLHLINAYYCDKCGKPFSGVDDLRDHMKTHSEEKTIDCDLRGKVFPDPKDLIIHNKNHQQSDGTLHSQMNNVAIGWVVP